MNASLLLMIVRIAFLVTLCVVKPFDDPFKLKMNVFWNSLKIAQVFVIMMIAGGQASYSLAVFLIVLNIFSVISFLLSFVWGFRNIVCCKRVKV
jgi:hypothetical protein